MKRAGFVVLATVAALQWHAAAQSPRRHDFTPTVFYRQFSPANEPVLKVAPGDTIHTTTIDSTGVDESGMKRAPGGNPQTGPFYIQGAAPGDTLKIHLTRVHLNRDWAVSDDFLVDRALDRNLAVAMKDGGNGIVWRLNVQQGVATPEQPPAHLARYSVPLKPMLGCIAVAANANQAAPGAADSGPWGGNMDFNEIVESVIVYLPVQVAGALLYLGDGHAAQGAGELNGNGLETSMDVEFTVDVIPNRRIDNPRVESATHIMSMGLAGSLDEAMRVATANMADWLMTDYSLTPSEVAVVLGTATELQITAVAGRNAGIVLKIDKARLQTLSKRPGG